MTKNCYVQATPLVIIFTILNLVRFVMLLIDKWYVTYMKVYSILFGCIFFVLTFVGIFVGLLYFKKKLKPFTADILYNFFILFIILYALQFGLEIKLMLNSYLPLYVFLIFIFILSEIRPFISFAYYILVAYLLSIIWIEHKSSDTNTMQQIFLLCIYLISLFRYYLTDYALRTSIFADETNEKLRRISGTDSLTQIQNRLSLNEGYVKYLGKKILVMFIDLDDFKLFNDRYSHEEGDRVLYQFAQKLISVFKYDQCYRYGGDEFIIIKEYEGETIKDFNLWKDELSYFYQVLGNDDVHVSIGYIIQDCKKKDDYQEIINKADERLHYVKAHGKNSIIGLIN